MHYWGGAVGQPDRAERAGEGQRAEQVILYCTNTENNPVRLIWLPCTGILKAPCGYLGARTAN